MNDHDLEKKLKIAEEKYRALFEFGPIGVAYHQMIYDENGRPFDYKFLEVNDNYYKFTGVDPSGKTVRQAFPGIEDDPFDWIGKFGEVAKAGKTLSVEQFLPLNNRWYNLVAYQYLPDHFVVAFLDITESKKAQSELKEVNAGMKSVLDASSRVSIIRTDINGIINLFNKGAEKLLGYTSDEVIGKETPLIFHKEAEVLERSIELTNAYGRVIKGFDIFNTLAYEGEVDERDWTYITKDGNEKSVTLSITPVYNSNNEITGFLGTAVDISDRKEMEKKLRDSENLFRSLFEESADAFLLIDNNQFIDCNHAAVKMFGAKDFNEIRAHHPSTLSPENQPDGRKSLEKANDMIDIAFKNNTNRFEWDHQKVNGDIFPTEVLLTRVNIGTKTLLHTCIRDITDRKEAEEQLRQAQKMEVVGQLAGGVAHDFNNMLSGIIGATEILQMELKENSKYVQYTNIIINAAERAAELTQQLLAFGRKGKQTTKIININSIINTVKDMLKHTINKNIEIVTELKNDTLSIKGDESQIQNVILNLCVNSRDAMPMGGILHISSDIVTSNGLIKDHEGIKIPNGKYVQVKVKDTGSGISESKINKIFEPFFTTKNIGQGTGLGLASVYGTIKSHNSFIQLNSIEGKGTTFTLLFLFNNSNSETKKIIKSEIKEKFRGKVLVIDDEQILRDTIKVMLESIGFTVILADNGVEGIKKYTKYKDEIDLVVLDIIMPQLNGRDCYQELKKINNKLKAIIVSGFTKDEEISDILKDNNINFLHKPFRKKELVSIVNEVLSL